jgi:hypothetical protein
VSVCFLPGCISFFIGAPNLEFKQRLPSPQETSEVRPHSSIVYGVVQSPVSRFQEATPAARCRRSPGFQFIQFPDFQFQKVDPTLEKAVATQFVHGIRNRSIRVTVAANSQGKADYTFKDVYQAVQAVARARRNDSGSESDSDSDSSSSSSATDSSRGGGSKRAHDAKRSKDYKAKEEEVDAKVTTPAPRFDMEELAKVIKEAVQATTRELVGSYGLGPGPVLGQPPQAPVIESYAVSSSSRPQFQGRGHPYGGQGGGYQQQFGGQPQQSGQQFGGYQQQPGQQFGCQQQSGAQQQQFGGQPQYAGAGETPLPRV